MSKASELIIRQMDAALRDTEQAAVVQLQRILSLAFNDLEASLRSARWGRIRSDLTLSNRERQILIVQQIARLQQFLSPNQQQAIEVSLQQLLTDVYSRTGQYNIELLRDAGASAEFSAVVPVENIVLIAQDTAKRLFRHTDDFANNAAAAIGMGISIGNSMSAIAKDIQSLAGGTFAQAEMLARTETINAAVGSAKRSFMEAGVEYWALVATAEGSGGRQTCKYCLGRNGQIYRIGESAPPLHPMCRCFCIPVLPGQSDIDWLIDFNKRAVEVGAMKPTQAATYWESKAGLEAPAAVWTPGSGAIDSRFKELLLNS